MALVTVGPCEETTCIISGFSVTQGATVRIIRRKEFMIQPMDEEEAAAQEQAAHRPVLVPVAGRRVAGEINGSALPLTRWQAMG